MLWIPMLKTWHDKYLLKIQKEKMVQTEQKPLFEIKDLETTFKTRNRTVHAVNGVSIHVNPGEIISIVGESGSGKSVTNLSALQLLQVPPAMIENGEVLFEEKDLLSLKRKSRELKDIRGGRIAMIFQEPMTSLNPVMTVNDQISESLIRHKGMNRKEARSRVIELLKMVKIPDAEERCDSYPHEFSGGMRQRIMIAMALSCDPKLLIADEPTTALDVTTQAQILELMQDIVNKTQVALIIITHNLGIVARYAHRIYVMYAGSIVESGPTTELFRNPRHAYTVGLLNSIPSLNASKDHNLTPIPGLPPSLKEKPEECSFMERCCQALDVCRNSGRPPLSEVSPGHFAACYNRRISKQGAEATLNFRLNREISDEILLDVQNLKTYFPVKRKAFAGSRKQKYVKAVDNVSFQVRRGETLGLVGESGCGKTTIARSILRLVDPTAGSVMFEGDNIAVMPHRKLRHKRSRFQLIFQDPFSSLNPRQTVGNIVGEQLIVHKYVKDKKDYNTQVAELFEQVGLNPSLMPMSPHELSGGQRQRIGIARALASKPSLIICDEPVSALDVSIQAQIINLLEKLQAELNLSFLFIAHDLSVVQHISDRIIVMYLGRIVEKTSWDELYANPMHPYTQALLSAIPIPDPDIELTRNRIMLPGEVPSPKDIPSGCPFHVRCKHATKRCSEEVPELKEVKPGHFASCFLY